MAPGPAEPGSPGADLGRVVTARGAGLVQRALVHLLCWGGVAAVLAGAALTAANAPARTPPWALSACGLAMAAGGLLLRPALRRVTEFREFGALVRRGGVVERSLRYDECERLGYHRDRHYHSGVYIGTTVVIGLRAPGRPGITWAGRHRERPTGWSYTVLGRGAFRGEDELDVVKLIIAEAMADRWVDRLLIGETIPWLGALELGADSAVVLQGPRKGERVRYADFTRLVFEGGQACLYHRGDDRPCLRLPPAGDNFWPGLRVLARVWSAPAGPGGG